MKYCIYCFFKLNFVSLYILTCLIYSILCGIAAAAVLVVGVVVVVAVYRGWVTVCGRVNHFGM